MLSAMQPNSRRTQPTDSRPGSRTVFAITVIATLFACGGVLAQPLNLGDAQNTFGAFRLDGISTNSNIIVVEWGALSTGDNSESALFLQGTNGTETLGGALLQFSLP